MVTEISITLTVIDVHSLIAIFQMLFFYICSPVDKNSTDKPHHVVPLTIAELHDDFVAGNVLQIIC